MFCKKELNDDKAKTLKDLTMVFKNILEEVKSANDFAWATRYISFAKSYNNPSKPFHTPQQLKAIMLEKDVLFKVLNEVPDSKIKETINEMASSYSLPVVRWLGYLLVKILHRTLSNLYVNEASLLQIKQNMGSNPVIFLPTHRSYADFILMAFVTFHYGIHLPYVAAGMDFHSMKFMGEVLRHCKAFFIRRQFADDKTYRTIFRNYLQLLMQLGESPIEFFIEGTRSRSSKSLPPKFGMLSMVLDAFIKGNVPNITLVPVCISYDRLLEEHLFAYEMLGVPKPKESTVRLIKAFSKLDGNYGNVYVNFGKPLLVREWISENCGEKITGGDNILLPHITCRLAHLVIQRQLELQVIGAFNIFAIVISFRISKCCENSIPLTEAVSEFEYISQLIKICNGTIHYTGGKVEDAILSACQTHSSLVHVNGTDIVFRNIVEDTQDESTDVFSGEKLDNLIPRVMLQLYINPVLHLLVPLALIMLSIHPAKTLYKGSHFDAYNYISTVYRLEFVTLCNSEKKDVFNKGVRYLKESKCITENGFAFGENMKTRNYLRHVMHPFMSGYYLVAMTLVKFFSGRTEITLTDILRSCVSNVDQLVHPKFYHPYGITKDLLCNAMKSFVSLNHVRKYSKDSEVYYVPVTERLNHFLYFTAYSTKVITNVNGLPKCRY